MAKNGVETAREQLREITGKYHAKLDMLNTETFSTVKPSKQSTDYIKLAEEKNLNLQVAKVTVDIAKDQIELAKAGHHPKLTLGASEDLEASLRAVTRNTITSYNQVVSDIATFKALEQAVVSAESALKATEAGFEVGTRTIVDVLVSTQNLFNAKRNLADVRYRYVVSTLRLKQAAGTLTSNDLQAINQGLKEIQ